jgi:hypothetical protein
MTECVRFYPDINYRAHPAFRDLDVPARTDDPVVDGMIRDIDHDLDALHNTRYDDHAAPRQAFDVGAGRRISELAAYLDRTTPNERVRRLLSRAFDDVRKELLDEARIRNDRHQFSRRLSPEAQRVADDLKRDGAHICRLTDAERKKLWELCAPVVARLRAAAVDPGTRVAEGLPRYSAAGVRLAKFFQRSAVLDALSAYFGSNVTFAGFALEYSHEKQNWWQDLYADVGLENPKTTYFHFDHGCRNPKAIVALSDVTSENGPTGYVKGSHCKPRSNFIHFMIKSIDHCFHDDKGAGAKNFYRRRFQEVEYRREFLMLPTALQACSHFGEDITDDTKLSSDLLKDEMKITHDVGNCVVFDGDYGIHRGALVKSGERFVFQVIFAVEPDMSKGEALKQRMRAIARRLLKGE